MSLTQHPHFLVTAASGQELSLDPGTMPKQVRENFLFLQIPVVEVTQMEFQVPWVVLQGVASYRTSRSLLQQNLGRNNSDRTMPHPHLGWQALDFLAPLIPLEFWVELVKVVLVAKEVELFCRRIKQRLFQLVLLT